MKFDKLWVFEISPDRIIHDDASLYAQLEGVPPARRWSTHPANATWNKLESKCFAGPHSPTILDKVIIVSHADPTSIGEEDTAKKMKAYSPSEFAHVLKNAWQMKGAGLITFKACRIGKGTFLEEFVACCKPNAACATDSCTRKLLKVGWVKGYTGSAMTVVKPVVRMSALASPFGMLKPTEVISEKVNVFGRKPLLPVTGARYKIVRGSAPTSIPHSRYVLND
jgi:hypothetical protein